ncbi:hypothetical protein PIB30_008727 [Stylosanthes scabra]|uniref:Aminotransferase-like plant mobile domain-containing protein n=1 Tax=Stylosanthes scabra TaxID=79078 RepID=A0ABU6V725_9FABA|nr:hypothetical protein [Stylosanthes scabra]
MPFLAPVLTAPSFPLSRRWVNWVLQDKEHRRWTLRHYRQMLDNITDDSFLWTPYDQHRLGPNVVPEDIYTFADLWNAPSPLISFEDLIGEWLNRVPVWVPGYEPPEGVPVDEYITWHNREYKAFLHLLAFEEEQVQHEDEDEPEEQPDQPQQECYVPYRSPTPIEIPPQENNQETVFPPHGSTPQPPSFPESSGRQLS